MNIEQLNSYIENKEDLDQKALSQIMLLIEKYPYFQIAHMLLLKAMYLTQPEKYNGQLKISASFISDKKKLYQYIHADKEQTVVTVEKKDDKIVKTVQQTVIEKTPEIKKIPEEKEETGRKEKLPEPEKIAVEEKLPLEEKYLAEEKTDLQEKIITEPVLIKEIPKEEEPIKKEAPVLKNELPEKEKIEEQQSIKREIPEIPPAKKEVSIKEETTEIFADIPEKKPEIKRKELTKENDEIQLNETTELKHKKIVTDFFQLSAKDKEEKKSVEPEKEQIVSRVIIPETKPKSETTENAEMLALLEEKRKRMMAKKETGQFQKPLLEKEQTPKIELEKPIKEETAKSEKEIVPIAKKLEQELTEKKKEIVTDEIPSKTTIDDTKTENGTSDAMNSIFSKIRQIKKEMNIETSQSRETIDINPNIESKKIIRTRKSDDSKGGGGKIIKESFIGFEDSEIKTNELIGETYTKLDIEEKTIGNKTEKEEIKLSEVTAKDLFKQHLQSKEKTEKEPVVENKEDMIPPVTKIVEEITPKGPSKLDVKEEEPLSYKETREKEEKSEKETSLIAETGSVKETAAEALLRRIAEKKKRMHEEREKEEQEKLQAKEMTSDRIEEIIEIPEIKSEKTIHEVEKEPVNKLEPEKKELKEITENKPKDLIDNFIEKVETLEKLGSKETSLTGDISEKSTQEQEEFMTETMADLLIQQKNYQKAIEIYSKLILKYPEKKTYFAIQIKKTQSLIK